MLRFTPLIALIILGGLAGCTPDAPPMAPYHSNGALRQNLDPVLWANFRARFIEGGRVFDRDNEGITHSEAQGYGLLLAEAGNDPATFATLWAWTSETLMRPDGLFAWRFGPCLGREGDCITDDNNASDAEILIAWALLRAGQRWGSKEYTLAASRITTAVADKLVTRQHDRLLLRSGLFGFEDTSSITVNPSYWVFPALDAFADAFPQGPWRELATAGRKLIDDARFGAHQLPPDWVDVGPDGLKPSERFDPVFGYNAIRVPLHLVWSREPVAAHSLAAFVAWWSDPAEASAPRAWVNLESGESAPYAWSTGMQAIAVLTLARAGAHPLQVANLPVPTDEDGYFSSSLTLLAHLAAMEAR